MTDTNIGRQSGAGNDAMTRARQAASGAAETASNLAEQASGLASKAASAIASEAQHKATGVMQQQIEAGADYARLVSGTAHSAARELENKAPELARMVHDVADRVEHFADDLRNRNVEEMIDVVWDFARRNPRMFLGGAIAAGFMLARFAKSSAGHSPGRSFSSDRSSDRSGDRSNERTRHRRDQSMRSAPDLASGSARPGSDSAKPPGATSGGASYAG